jgi:hypothetical protein
MPAIPHFDLPFRYHNGQAAVNEQGTDADIAACVFAVCATEPGQFLDTPLFGLPDLVGSQVPIPTSAVIGPISRWEPRARILAEVNPSLLNAAIQNANVEVEVAH